MYTTGTYSKKSGGLVLLQMPSSGNHRDLNVSGSSYTLHNPVYGMTNEASVSTTDNPVVMTGIAEPKSKSGNEMTMYDIAHPNPRSALKGTVYDVIREPPRPETKQIGGCDITVHSMSQPQKVQAVSVPEYDYAYVPQQQSKDVSNFESAHPSYSYADTSLTDAQGVKKPLPAAHVHTHSTQ